MPKISLRTTDEQHHDLVTAAKRNHRSLNNEILHRCFPPSILVRDNEGAIAELDHFKPDPKPGKK